MVTKKRNKFLSLAIYASLAIVLCYFVYAGTSLTSKIGGNNFTIEEDIYTLINISVNLSISGASSANITEVNITFPTGITIDALGTNTSALENTNITISGQTISFVNATDVNGWLMNASGPPTQNGTSFTINISAATPGNYNITITGYNYTDRNSTNFAFNGTLNVYVNDSSYPTGLASDTATEATQLRAHGNYSGSKILNFTITEDLPSFVFFNITNSTGQLNLTLNASRQGTGTYWNATLVTTTLLDGNYSLRIHVNDTSSGEGTNHPGDISFSNNTFWVRNFTIDNSAPSVSIAKSSSTQTSLTLTITITEPTSGVGGTCGSSRADATITGSGTTTQTLTEGSLSCGTNYSYTITCGDGTGNQGSATVGFKTSACGSGGSSSSSSSGGATTWTNTYNYASEELSEKGPLTKEFGAKQRTKLRINDAIHYAGVTELTASTAKIEISSTPQEATLNIGDTRKFDVDGSGAIGETYDLSVTLNGIANNKADLTISAIDETITADTQAAQQQDDANAAATAGDESGASGDDEGEPSSLLWLWIVIAVVIIGGGIAWFVIAKKK